MRAVLEVLGVASSVAAEVYVVLNLLRGQNSSPALVLLCLVAPLYSTFGERVLWGRGTYYLWIICGMCGYAWCSVAVFYANNPSYLRLLAMNQIATKAEHRQEVHGGGLKEYVKHGRLPYSTLRRIKL